MKTEIGDWVRFYRDGRLVIGVVEYRRQDEFTRSEWYAQTTSGEVNEADVLERRPKEAK